MVVDLRQLEFMNSSCFKCLVTWLHRLQQAPAADRYAIRIVSSPSVSWQKRSLYAIRAFAPDLVTVEER